MIKIHINKYDPTTFIFAKEYLIQHQIEWYGVPRHRVKPYLPQSFMEDLDNGKLDFNEYDLTCERFDWQEFFIIERYYNQHYLLNKNYDKYVNIERIYSELGSNGSRLKKRNHPGGKKKYRTRRRNYKS
jgi:hypothetical protein